MKAEIRKPNHPLRHERELRGWSLDQVAEELHRLSGRKASKHGIINGKMISRWELGQYRPSRFWQEKLSRLYGKSLEALGFVKPLSLSEDFPARATTDSQPGTDSLPTPHEAVNLLLEASERRPEELLGAWLALRATDLALLFQERWSIEDILTSLRVVLKGVQMLPNISRRTLLQLGAAALLSGIPLPEGRHISAEERIELHRTLGESIAAGWQLFHTAGNAQVLVVGQAQLALVQQAHALLFSQVRAMFYTGVYNLIGRARHLQEHYDEALQAHMSAHIAALGAGDPLHVAQSLICLADTYQALGHYPEAIQSVEEALRTIGNSDEEHLRTRAHLLGCWADYAMTLEDYEQAQRKLDEALPYLGLLTPKEEFDRASWLQLAGKRALMSSDYRQATDYLEEALAANPPHWLVRQAGILIPLAIAYARRRERDVSLQVARQALPVLSALNAPMTNKQFADFLRQDLIGLFPHDRHIRTFVMETQRQFPQLAPVV
jgi:tetratricopeptide (TPR) repeat protein